MSLSVIKVSCSDMLSFLGTSGPLVCIDSFASVRDPRCASSNPALERVLLLKLVNWSKVLLVISYIGGSLR
jgi:hypothetical protein